MSADNGVYMHKFKKGWKVCYAQAIENIYYGVPEGEYNYGILGDYFSGSLTFETEEEAMVYAEILTLGLKRRTYAR